jgi:hypothetical protein
MTSWLSAVNGETVLDIEPVDLESVTRTCWDFVGEPDASLVVETDTAGCTSVTNFAAPGGEHLHEVTAGSMTLPSAPTAAASSNSSRT